MNTALDDREAQAYIYYDEKLDPWHSSQPRTDEAALTHYTEIFGFEPAFIHAVRWDGTKEALK